MSDKIISRFIPDKAKLQIRLNGGADAVIEIEDRVISGIGTSYKVRANRREIEKSYKSGGHREYFLKLPPLLPVPLRETLGQRTQKEALLGREVNILAKTLSTLQTGEFKFKLPLFLGHGTISSVSGDPNHEFCGMPFLIYEWRHGLSLDKVVEGKSPDISATDFRCQWQEFATGFTSLIAELHNHGILHAYIVPRNVIINKIDNNIECALVGFGYSSLSIEESSAPVNEIEEDKPFQAPEFRHRRPLDALWHSADIYSIGALLFYIAIGRSPLDVLKDSDGYFPKDIEALKTAVSDDLRTARGVVPETDQGRAIADVLANPNVAKIIDNCLRYDSEDRIDSAEILLEAIDISLTQIPKTKSRSRKVHSFFNSIIETKAANASDLTQRLERKHHFELYGSRTIIIGGLCRLLKSIVPDGRYCTISLPSYWAAKNLGPDGRFLAMNKQVASEGVRINRVFLVSGAFHILPDDEQQILINQEKAMLQTQAGGQFEVKVKVVLPEVVQRFERTNQSVAFVVTNAKRFSNEHGELRDIRAAQIRQGEFLCLNFISRGNEKRRYGKVVIEREIKKVRIWDPYRGDVYKMKLAQEIREFNKVWKSDSTFPISTYIRQNGGVTLNQLLKSAEMPKK